MLLYVVVRVVDKKKRIVDMVWSVRLELGGGEFKPWLKQKMEKILVFFLVVLWCA